MGQMAGQVLSAGARVMGSRNAAATVDILSGGRWTIAGDLEVATSGPPKSVSNSACSGE